MTAQADDAEDPDDKDGWEGMHEQLSADEHKELQQSVQPLCLILVKVHMTCNILSLLSNIYQCVDSASKDCIYHQVIIYIDTSSMV